MKPGTLFIKKEKAGGRYIYYVALKEFRSRVLISSHISRSYAARMMKELKDQYKRELKQYSTYKQNLPYWLIGYTMKNSQPEFAFRED